MMMIEVAWTWIDRYGPNAACLFACALTKSWSGILTTTPRHFFRPAAAAAGSDAAAERRPPTIIGPHPSSCPCAPPASSAAPAGLVLLFHRHPVLPSSCPSPISFRRLPHTGGPSSARLWRWRGARGVVQQGAPFASAWNGPQTIRVVEGVVWHFDPHVHSFDLATCPSCPPHTHRSRSARRQAWLSCSCGTSGSPPGCVFHPSSAADGERASQAKSSVKGPSYLSRSPNSLDRRCWPTQSSVGT
jgi:hypothetical protein